MNGAARDQWRRFALRHRLGGLAAVLSCLALAAPAVAAPCPDAGPAVQDLATSAVYSNSQGSVVDAAREANNQALRTGLNAYLASVTAVADRYAASHDPADRQCALALLSQWGRQRALLNGRVSWQGRAVRSWAAGTLALAALKLDGPLPADVRGWFEGLGDALLQFRTERGQRYPDGDATNISYWVGMSLGALAVVLNDDRLRVPARTEFTVAMAAIAPNGTLKAELNRASRACKYHAFAAEPLVVLGRLSRLHGEDLLRGHAGQLDRLLALVARCVADPQSLASAAGHAQEPVAPQSWLLLYPGGTGPAGFDGRSAGNPQDIRLGGNIRLLDAALRRAATERR